jgi:hypothetical protein
VRAIRGDTSFDTNAGEQWRTSANNGMAKTLEFAASANFDEQ